MSIADIPPARGGLVQTTFNVGARLLSFGDIRVTLRAIAVAVRGGGEAKTRLRRFDFSLNVLPRQAFKVGVVRSHASTRYSPICL